MLGKGVTGLSTYYIGDVHGCYDELRQLLRKIHFNTDKDRLIFVGDLINRGPKSLEVLRFVRDLGESATVVLGNHDLSFIAYMAGAYHGRRTNFPLMALAKDSEQLCEWLRFQSLLVYDKRANVVAVHAALPPEWSLKKSMKQAAKAEKRLRGEKFKKYLKKAYQGGSSVWHDDWTKYDKFRYRINAFTRLRYCDEQGVHHLQEKRPLGEQEEGLVPWFEQRKTKQGDESLRIIFGHWAALGYYQNDKVVCLDSGCAWGGALTALKVEQQHIERVSVPSLQKKPMNY